MSVWRRWPNCNDYRCKGLEGGSPLEVCEHMSERGIFVAGGDFYATTLVGKLGINETGGFVRAGLAPYTTAEEVGAFLDALEELAVR